MKLRPGKRRLARALALPMLAATSLQAAMPAPVAPRLLTLRPHGIYIGMEGEFDHETRTTADGRFSTSVDRSYLAPLVGGGIRGSIYHPNLFQYDFLGEGGYAWQDLNGSSDAGTRFDRTENGWLARYNANTLILSEKPYASSFNATKSRTFRELDFFNRVTVDSESYSGRSGYSAGPVPFSVTFTHMEEVQSDAFVDTSLNQDTIELRAQNKRREKNVTDFLYTYGNYVRETENLFNDEGTYHTASLNDVEYFGRDDRMVLTSALTFHDVDSTTLPSTDFRATENLSIEHSKTVQTLYDGTFSYYSSGPVDSLANFARAAVRHQLYESLTSTFDVHGDHLDTSSTDASQEVWRYGIGLSEGYTKRVSTWGRLTMGNNARLDREDRDTEGGLISILNEQHVLRDGQTVFLNQPNVVTVLSVTDSAGIPFAPGLDYELIDHGALTEIRRILTSPRLLNGTIVLVDYSAQSQPSGAFYTFSDQFQFRLDFFKGLFGIYSRLGWVENTDTERFVLEDSFTSQSGVDASWRFARAGAEYETRDSNLISYNAVNVFESFFFEPTDAMSLNLDFRQRWARFQNNDNITDYSFIARWHWRLSSYLFFTAEGGIRFEEGNTIDQRLATARSEMNFNMGKLRVLLGYQFNNDDVRGELREKHFVYLRAKRYF
jgi:hypothetical protein